MSYTQVGACPRCGAPIYSPSPWMSITPPPSQHTCNCAGSQSQVFSSNSTMMTGTPINPFPDGFDTTWKPAKQMDYSESVKPRPRLTDVHERASLDKTTS